MKKSMLKVLSVFLTITFVTGQFQMSFAFENLAVWTPDGTIRDFDKESVDKAKPGNVGNGEPSKKLLREGMDWIPKLDKNKYSDLLIEIREATDSALKLYLQNKNKIPVKDQDGNELRKRAEKTKEKLIDFQMNINKQLFLFANENNNGRDIITGPEDYLVLFNFLQEIGLSIEFINYLYSKYPEETARRRLAQAIFHEATPEHLKDKGGDIEIDRTDHRLIYKKIQSPIFGKEAVEALGIDFREFIEESLFLSKEVSEALKECESVCDSLQNIDDMEGYPVKIENYFDGSLAKLRQSIPTAVLLNMQYMYASDAARERLQKILRQIADDTKNTSIARIIAQSALYSKSSENKDEENEKQILKSMIKTISNPIALKIGRQVLRYKTKLISEILNDIRQALIKDRTYYINPVTKALKELTFASYEKLTRADLEGKVVYVRIACDVLFDKTKGIKEPGRIIDTTRIDVVLPTIERIIRNGGKIVLQPGWGGRPKGIDKDLSVIPVFLYIREKLLERRIIKDKKEMVLTPTNLETEEVDSIYKNMDKIQATVQKELREGSKVKIVCLENPRFDEEYGKGEPELARKLAEMVDLAVYDNYNQAHRPVPDINVLPLLVPSYIGERLEEEIKIANGLLKKLAEPGRKPFVLFLGGKKIETKPDRVSKVTVVLNLIKRGLMRKGDKILIGGGVSYGFMVAKAYLDRIKNSSGGIDDNKVTEISADEIKDVIGDSYISDESLETDEGMREAHERISIFARLLLEAENRGIKVFIPGVHKIRNKETGQKLFGQTTIPRGWYGTDIDGETITEYKKGIKGIGIGVMAGPMGIMDKPEVSESVQGTDEVLKALAAETKKNKAFTLSAGGESTSEAIKIGAELTYRSIGGGATLEYIEKEGRLDGLVALSASKEVVVKSKEAEDKETTLFLSDEVEDAMEIINNCCNAVFAIPLDVQEYTEKVMEILENVINLKEKTSNPIVSVISSGMIYGCVSYESKEEKKLRGELKSIVNRRQNSITAAIAQGILYKRAVLKNLQSEQEEKETMERIMRTATSPIAQEICSQILKTKRRFLEIVSDVREKVLEEKHVTPSADSEENRIEITYKAEFLKHNLIQWRKEHPGEILLLAMDSDIGEEQEAQIMPLWKILDAVKHMTDSDGKLIFQESEFRAIRRSGSNGDLMGEINYLLDTEKKLSKGNIFLVGRQANIEADKFDSLKDAAWITGIDDSKAGAEVYLPVFEALTLTIMSACKADLDTIKRFYDRISNEPVSLEKLQEMIGKQLIYILPRMDRKDSQELRKLYEATLDVYMAV